MHAATESVEKRATQKVMIRILPFVFLLYIVAFVDRVNLGYAALEMNKALGLTSEIFGFASGIFFIGYFLFEVPSNVMLHRFGARVWITRILVSWGIVVVLTAWAQSAMHLYILRFALGLAEAGFFPGIILYITYWFRTKEQARAVALFMTALAAANVIGAPVSTWIMDNVQWFSMAGWRWMFVLEGIPAILCGAVTYFYLTDRPEDAAWLSPEEKEWLTGELRKEHAAKLAQKRYTALEVLRNPRVWHLAAIYFTLIIGLYGVGFWMPTIIKAFPGSLTNTLVGLIAMIPHAVGCVAMILWARHSDRTGERRMHAVIPAAIGGTALLCCGLTGNPYLSILAMAGATAGIYSFFGPFWSLPAMFLSGTSAAVGIAMINSIGNLGGFVGPYMIGYLKQQHDSMVAGLFFMSLSLLICANLVMLLKRTAAPVPKPAQTEQGS